MVRVECLFFRDRVREGVGCCTKKKMEVSGKGEKGLGIFKTAGEWLVLF